MGITTIINFIYGNENNMLTQEQLIYSHAQLELNTAQYLFYLIAFKAGLELLSAIIIIKINVMLIIMKSSLYFI